MSNASKICCKIVQKLQELTDIINSCDLELRVLLIDKATLDSYDYYDVTINLHNVEGITTNLPAVNRYLKLLIIFLSINTLKKILFYHRNLVNKTFSQLFIL